MTRRVEHGHLPLQSVLSNALDGPDSAVGGPGLVLPGNVRSSARHWSRAWPWNIRCGGLGASWSADLGVWGGSLTVVTGRFALRLSGGRFRVALDDIAAPASALPLA